LGQDDEMGPTAVSPDGAWLYYVVTVKGGRFSSRRGEAVFRTPALGGVREKIADDSQHHWTLCARASSVTCVLVESNERQLSFYSLDSQGHQGSRLTSMALGTPRVETDISTDGTRAAVLFPTERRIRVLSLKGDAPHDVMVTGHDLDASVFFWSADWAGWYVSSTPSLYPGSTELLHVDMNGRVSTLWHQNVRDPMSAIPSARMAAISRSPSRAQPATSG
jgi:hypothetical protein